MDIARTSRNAICAVLFCSPFVLFHDLNDYSNLPQTILIQWGAILLFVLEVFKATLEKRIQVTDHLLNRLTLIFMIWVCASVAWAFNRPAALVPVRHIVACICIGFLLLHNLDSFRQAVPIIGAIFLSGIGIAIIGCMQSFIDFQGFPQAVAPAATFANKNVGAQFIGLVLPAGFLLFFLFPSWYRRLPILLGLAIQVLYLYLTRSRTAWLVGFSTFGLYGAGALWVTRRHLFRHLFQKRFLGGIAILCLFIALLPVIYPTGKFTHSLSIFRPLKHEIVQKGKTVSRDTILLRLIIWENTLKMISDHPFWGRGPGNFSVFYPAYHRAAEIDPQFNEAIQPRAVHNDYLQVWAELGVVGFGLFAGLLLFSARAARGLICDDVADTSPYWGLFFLSMIIGFGIEAFFSFPMERAMPPLLLFIALPLMVKCDQLKNPAKTVCLRFPLKTAIPVLTGAIILGVFALIYTGKHLISDYYYQKTLIAEHQEAWASVIGNGRIAVHYNHHHIDALSAIGRAYIRQNKARQAIPILKQVLKNYPYYLNTYLNLGVAYDLSGDYHSAIRAFNRALQIKPDYIKALINIGKIMMKRKAYREASIRFEKALALDQKNTQLMGTIGLLKIYTKDFRDAAAIYHRILEIDPTSATAHKMLAQIYSKHLNKAEEARFYQKQYRKLSAPRD